MEKTISIDDIMRWNPCGRYDRDTLLKLSRGLESLGIEEILKLDIPPEDILWVVLRVEVLGESDLLMVLAAIAESVLRYWTAQFPTDSRISKCIEMIRLYAMEETGLRELKIAAKATASALATAAVAMEAAKATASMAASATAVAASATAASATAVAKAAVAAVAAATATTATAGWAAETTADATTEAAAAGWTAETAEAATTAAEWAVEWATGWEAEATKAKLAERQKQISIVKTYLQSSQENK